jgi:hypothetical protein
MKIFLVSINKEPLFDIADNLYKLNENLSISPCFSTDVQYKDELTYNTYYLDTETIRIAYKNNSLLCVVTNNYISSGITIDDFYNNDIFIMNMKEFNTIPKKVFDNYDILTIWVDTKNSSKISQMDMLEVNFFVERIENLTYLYFLENEQLIEDTIYKYIYGEEEEKNKILLENN